MMGMLSFQGCVAWIGRNLVGGVGERAEVLADRREHVEHERALGLA